MSVNTSELPPINPESDTLLLAMEESMQAQQSLFEVVANWTESHTEDPVIAGYADAAAYAGTAFVKPLEIILESGDLSQGEKARSIAALVSSADVERRKAFQEIVPSAQLDRLLGEKLLIKDIKKILNSGGTSEDICKRAMIEYHDGVLYYVNGIIDAVPAKSDNQEDEHKPGLETEAKPPTPVESANHQLGKHVMDIAKVSAGVTIGAIIALRLHGKLNK